MPDNDKYNVLDKQFVELDDFPCSSGWILDFGGGGEGIIGQLKGSQVIAIDRLESELKEAVESGSKALNIIMDGTELKFLDKSFMTATAFYSLMFIRNELDIEKVIKEIFRVLQPGRKFHIWDINFINEIYLEKEISAFDLEIILPSGKKVETGYGARKKSQDTKDFLEIARKVGFQIESVSEFGLSSYIIVKKEA